MSEQRNIRRQRVLKGGRIAFNNDAGISCVIRNLSDHGAALDVSSPFGIPEQFTLVFEDGRPNKHCHVVWRKARRIGITFDRA